MQVPRDHPYASRSQRVYIALTNHCNRSCPWCSMYSSPDRSTFISEEAFLSVLPEGKSFELQLEGGEPTLHPLFWRFVEIGRVMKGCERIVLCTNGTSIPRQTAKLRKWLLRLGQPLTIKISLNHHLLDRDPGLIELCTSLTREFANLSENNLLVINVRLRKGVENDDFDVRDKVEKAGLLPWSNVFFLQRYGLAKHQETWEEPFAVADNFRLINPDGQDFGTDLIGRSEAMGRLR